MLSSAGLVVRPVQGVSKGERSDFPENLVRNEKTAMKVGTQGNRANSLPINITAARTDMKRLVADAETRVKKLGRPSSGKHHARSFGRTSGAQNRWTVVGYDG